MRVVELVRECVMEVSRSLGHQGRRGQVHKEEDLELEAGKSFLGGQSRSVAARPPASSQISTKFH